MTDKKNGVKEYSFEESEPCFVSEALAEYAKVKRQGEYTLEDYLALPDDQRVELIDGVIYDMAAPNYIHQVIALRVGSYFLEYIDRKHGSCFVLAAPVDVQLDCDDRTVVQPDVLILCDPTKFRKGRVFGAPDMVVEVLSKSTSSVETPPRYARRQNDPSMENRYAMDGSRDRRLKLVKYKNAGVREYWIVDPDKKRIFVYEFEKSDFPRIYGFEDRVPLGIYQGECEVDFAQIYERIRPLYDTM